jgi:MFS superfamily sulfate permease-like transporter
MSNDNTFIVLGADEEIEDGLGSSSKRPWSKKFSKESLLRAYHYVSHPNGSPLWTEIKSNLKPGITVSLVSVPLSISLAIAGGATPVMGIVTGTIFLSLITLICKHFGLV